MAIAFFPITQEYDLVEDFAAKDPCIPLHTQLYLVDHDEYGALITGAFVVARGTLIKHKYQTRLSEDVDGKRMFTSYAYYSHGIKKGFTLDETIYSNRTEYNLNGKELNNNKRICNLQKSITSFLNEKLHFLLNIALYPKDERIGVFIVS